MIYRINSFPNFHNRKSSGRGQFSNKNLTQQKQVNRKIFLVLVIFVKVRYKIMNE